MTDPKHISIADFHYSLPEERIARYPLENRDDSKLLIWKAGEISGSIYSHIADHLPVDSMLIFNNTKVVEARLLFRKPTGGVIEIFCLEPHECYPDIQSAMQQQGSVKWLCLIGGASKWKPGQLLKKKIFYNHTEIELNAAFLEKRTGVFAITLSWNLPSLSFAEILHLAGNIPLPPYLNRDTEESDKLRYQTVYAKEQGSVAAPTAGLHFTEKIFQDLSRKGIPVEQLTLHVGAGTFQPVKADTMEGHLMHAEWMDVSKELIKKLLSSSRRVIAVGTTSARTLESLYWLGIKCSNASMEKDNSTFPEIDQWDPYELNGNFTKEEALTSLLNWMEKRNIDRLITKTRLLIAPGYTYRIVQGLITNFHQPSSTLLLLVSAITGDDWRRIYSYALENQYRFLSYGDGCLLLPA
jgi:S-adenosylmethionine:tRNA ribosyltransferase-isomerase